MHRNVAPASSVNEKLADVWFVGFAGFAVIVGAAGGVRSIVQLNVVAAPTLPAGSFASTLNVWLPAASGPE